MPVRELDAAEAKIQLPGVVRFWPLLRDLAKGRTAELDFSDQ